MIEESTVLQASFAVSLFLGKKAIEKGKLEKLVDFIVLKVPTEDRYLQLGKPGLSQELGAKRWPIDKTHKSKRVFFI